MKNKIRKVSVVTTLLNEETTTSELLESLISQTLKPTEIVICDGGSSDSTVTIIKSFQKKYPFIKFIISSGNVAHGRNVSIRHAKGNIVLCIDAGCTAKKDWVEKITRPFREGNVDIVAGFYEMKSTNSFQKIMALYRGTHPKRYDSQTFIPSCRSVAFKKKVWEEIGKFNETLSLSGEDTDFFYRAITNSFSIKRVKDAIVYWNEPMQFGFKDFKKFYYYAKGDAQTGIWWDPIKKWKTHNIKILTIYLRYSAPIFLIFLYMFNPSYTYIILLLSLFCIYASWSIWKWSDVIVKLSERMWIPVIQIGSDVMVMSGFLVGLLNK
jgi:glycosyltransferase involved in cell wall biosynthesis